MKRRDCLKTSAAAGGGAMISRLMPDISAQAALPVSDTQHTQFPDQNTSRLTLSCA